MLTKDFETRIKEWEVDENPNTNDAHVMDNIGTICAWKGLMYVDVRKVIAPENECIDTDVCAKFDNNTCIIIYFITKGEDITEKMEKKATDFIDKIKPYECELCTRDAASDYIVDMVKKADDPITFKNLMMSTTKYMAYRTMHDYLYGFAKSMYELFYMIQEDHKRGIHY